MEVLRMENEKGFGPFVASNPDEFAKHVPWIKALPNGEGLIPDKTHPHHFEDIPGSQRDSVNDILMVKLLGVPVSWKIGVKSKSQFLHWFPQSSLSYFASLGFHLSEYNVPDEQVKQGKWQVMFPAQSATLVKAEPLEQVANDNSL